MRQKIKDEMGDGMMFLSINHKHNTVAYARALLERGKRVAIFHPVFGLKEAVLNNGNVACVPLAI
jgi:hypothetical protein